MMAAAAKNLQRQGPGSRALVEDFGADLISERLHAARWRKLARVSYRRVTAAAVLRQNAPGSRQHLVVAGDDLGSLSLFKVGAEATQNPEPALQSELSAGPRRIKEVEALGNRVLVPQGQMVQVFEALPQGQLRKIQEIPAAPSVWYSTVRVTSSEEVGSTVFATHCESDKHLRWWDTRAPPRPIRSVPVEGLSIKSLKMCAEDPDLVSIMTATGGVRVYKGTRCVLADFADETGSGAMWDPYTESFERPVARHRGPLTAAIPLDDHLLLTADDTEMKLWSLHSGRGLTSLGMPHFLLAAPKSVQLSKQSSPHLYGVFDASRSVSEFKVCRRTQQIEYLRSSFLDASSPAEAEAEAGAEHCNLAAFHVSPAGTCAFLADSLGNLFAKHTGDADPV